MTPDSLRALPVVAWSKEWRDAYADAWEARERRIALLEGDLRTAKANWDAACDDAAKLEADNAALRELLRDLDGGLDDYWCENNPEVVAAFHVALATQPEVKP